MDRSRWWNERTLRLAIIFTLSVVVLDGFVTAFLFVKPFWIDEWRIIYNLKTKDIQGLWGPLDYLQQFPRLYLSLVKVFTAEFAYSYRALRLPSFVVGTCAILLAWRLMRRIYHAGNWLQYLFVMIVVSSQPFTKYYVQIKQYSMDIALSLVAVWQVLELLRLTEKQPVRPGRYLLLCGSFLLAPFFSYTYSIAIAPAFILLPLMSVKSETSNSRRQTALQWLPLCLCALSIAAFYATDARQLLADKGMKAFWQYNLAGALDIGGILSNFYTVFAQVGSGFLFQTIFGILGVVAFLWACRGAFSDVRRGGSMSVTEWMRLYSVLLLLLVGALFLAGKLPLGESRLNAFMTISINMLVIDLLCGLQKRFPRYRAAEIIGGLLYVGVVGNIFTTIINNYTDEDQQKKRQIYTTIGQAVHTARAHHLPILATPGVTYPYEQDQNLPDTSRLPGDWVLKTHPAYHFADNIPVYPIADVMAAPAVLDTLPQSVDSVIVCDGLSFRIIPRN